jgi:phosphoglycolate phosphatase
MASGFKEHSMMFPLACDSIIFDLDGTLWDASGSTAVGWGRVARSLNLTISITSDSIRSVSGLPFNECVETLFPGLSEKHPTLGNHLDLAEKEEVLKSGGELYPGVASLIPKLKEKYRLFIVSNCQEWYLKSFLEHSKLQPYIEDVLCYGQTNLSKSENIQELVRRNQLRKPIYVGDTEWDQHAAFFAGVKFIFARYGFGSINTKRCPNVNSFPELSEFMMAPQTELPRIEIKKLMSSHFDEAQRFYRSVDYAQKLDPENFYYGAFHNNEMIGIVRLAFENGVWVLRGMQIRAAYQFLGIGTRLIKALEADIPSKDCFCLPYKWLDKFYGQIGFRTIPHEAAPAFLLKRLAEYQSPDFILMKRSVPS